MKHSGNKEFAVHFLKHPAGGRRTDRYTVAVWERQQLRAICHVAPIDRALAALRREMESAGEPILEKAEDESRSWRMFLKRSKVLVLKLASILLGGSAVSPKLELGRELGSDREVFLSDTKRSL
jgi:hypothetical protein